MDFLTAHKLDEDDKLAALSSKDLGISQSYEEHKWLIERAEEQKHIEDLQDIVYDLWEEEFFEEQKHPQLEDTRTVIEREMIRDTSNMTWEEFLQYQKDLSQEEKRRESSETIRNAQQDRLRKKIMSAGLSDSDAKVVEIMLESLRETTNDRYREANEERLIAEEAVRRSWKGEKVETKVSRELKDSVDASLRRRVPSHYDKASSSSIAAP